MNHPPRGAASKKIEPQRNVPPIANAQNPKADSRGNGSSRAPIICGMNRIDTASKIGMAKRNIITDPCSVKTWPYMSADNTSLPGRASCRRISRASTPPNRKKTSVSTTYQRPTTVLLTADQ